MIPVEPSDAETGSAARTPRDSGGAVDARRVGAVVLLALVRWLIWRVPPALYAYLPDPKNRAAAEASTRTGLITGLAGLAALGGLAVTTHTYRLAEQGHLTDRYTKAIEQLGSATLDVRLGGIYALEQIATDSRQTRDQAT